MAIRWASDRIDEQGVIAFVTNGSWIDGNTEAGVRACLVEEFSSIHVLHLRGDQRTQGEMSRREGGKVSVVVHALLSLSQSSSKTQMLNMTVVAFITVILVTTSHASRNWRHCKRQHL